MGPQGDFSCFSDTEKQEELQTIGSLPIGPATLRE